LSPIGVAVDSAGNLYIADSGNNVVREVKAATGKITMIAGFGAPGFSGDGGPATSAELNAPQGVAVDAHGNVFIADTQNNVLREVNASTGTITTVAGDGKAGYSGDGGPATTAARAGPSSVAAGSSGTLFIADSGNNVVRKVSIPAIVVPPPAKVLSASIQQVKAGKKTTEVIVLQFNEALNAARAQNVVSYSVVTVPKTKKQKATTVVLSQATYNAGKFAVTLVPLQALAAGQAIQLTVKAASLLDALGRPLDGGVNFVTVLS